MIAACSSSSEGGRRPEPDAAPAAVVAGNEPDATSGAGHDAAASDASAPEASGPGSVGECASCTAGKCGAELRGCAASQGCTNALVEFNRCYGASSNGSAACGADFASSGPAAAAMWKCMSAKCTRECG